MTMYYPTHRIEFADLHPVARQQFSNLEDRLMIGYWSQKTKTLFRPQMGYRSPEVQDGLYAQGRTKKGDVVTKARGWESAHQFGLAVDFVAWVIEADQIGTNLRTGRLSSDYGVWSWSDEHDWKYLKEQAELVGLTVPIKWDRPHVQHPAWETLRARLRG